MPLTFTSKLSICSTPHLQLGQRLGGGKLDLKGCGTITILFEPTLHSPLTPIRLADVDLQWDPFQIALPQGSVVEVKDLVTTREDFDLPACTGILNRETEEFHLTFAFTLHPARIHQMARLGITRPIRVSIIERGQLSMKEGRLVEAHGDPFTLRSNLPAGILAEPMASGHNSKHSCSATAHLYVTLADITAGEREQARYYMPKEAWVCPKDQFALYWVIDNQQSAVSAEISAPGLQNITGFLGKNPPVLAGVTASPAPPDVDYTLSVVDNADCTSKDSVHIHRVDTGSTRLLSATGSSETNFIWSLDIPKFTNSSSIIVTSIRTVECFTGGGYADWACQKTDPDGQVRNFPVHVNPTTPFLFPLVGSYLFQPTNLNNFVGSGQHINANNACFLVTLKCS
ncbi:hypothetical protein [Cupriavidus necator]|uniref:hypothetical protein n=1 Tax=Cupriavidus necator TaxID=106590 RepID=UPI0012D34813|nr:hypothetical protein [Cupriavidus necator]